MVYQDPAAALNPVMTIGRQLKEALDAHRRLPAATARAEILEVLARVRLPEPAGLLKRYPHQRSEEHTSELQSLMRTPYAVFCLKKKNTPNTAQNNSKNN